MDAAIDPIKTLFRANVYFDGEAGVARARLD